MKKLLLTTLALAALHAAQAQEDARQSLEKLLETQRLVSKEENDWLVGRELMQGRVDLLRRESETLRERIEQTNRDRAETEAKLAELRAQNEALKQGAKPLQDDIRKLESRVRGLLPRTPESVRQRVAPLSQRIMVETKAGLSERYQNVVGVLNELNKTAREVSVASEIRTLLDGRQVEVTVFYIGLSQAYYLNERSRVAGIGKLGDYGQWAWEEHNDSVDAIAAILGVYRGERPAVYVPIHVAIPQ